MNRYFIRRLLATIPLMFVISIFVFMFIHLIPGDPAKTLAGVEASVEEVEAIREEFGLNKPILVQYVDYMKNLFHGDMGRSLKSISCDRNDRISYAFHSAACSRRYDMGTIPWNLHRCPLCHFPWKRL